ncbi:hypothetical protein MASR1M31_13690 [Porphyromonadaceae bacterium]
MYYDFQKIKSRYPVMLFCRMYGKRKYADRPTASGVHDKSDWNRGGEASV